MYSNTSCYTIIKEDKGGVKMIKREEVYKGYTEEELRKMFNKIKEKDENWKEAPNKTGFFRVHYSLADLAIATIEFYHGNTPRIVGREGNYIDLRARGYQC